MIPHRVRMSLLLPWLPLGLAGVLAASTSAQPFEPNHLFVTGATLSTALPAVFEFDAQGVFVQTIELSETQGVATGLAFGPDGRLYVGLATTDSAKRVFRLGADLEPQVFLDELDGIDDVGQVAFGPRGRLYVGSRLSESIRVADPEGVVVDSIELETGELPAALRFGPDGHLLVSVHGSTGKIVEFDEHGQRVREFGAGTLGNEPGPVLWHPGATLLVPDASADQIEVFSLAGDPAGTLDPVFATLHGPFDLIFGPDGLLYLTNTGSSVVMRLQTDGTFVDQVVSNEMTGSQHLAFAPFRFQARLKGTSAQFGEALDNEKDPHAVLSLAPGSRTLLLELDPAAELAARLGSAWQVFTGFEAASGAEAAVRLFHGLQLGFGEQGFSGASILLRVSGKVADDGRFAVKKAAGTLHWADSDAASSLVVKTGKVVKLVK